MELRRVSQPDTMSNLHYYSACRLCLEPRSPALPADSSPPESPGKPKNTAVGSLSLLQGILPAQESNWGLLHGRWILYQLSYQGSPCMPIYIYIHIYKYIYIYIFLVYAVLVKSCYTGMTNTQPIFIFYTPKILNCIESTFT